MLPLHRLLSLAEYVARDWQRPEDHERWEMMLDDASAEIERRHGLAAPMGVSDGRPPSWWDEEDAGAEALALARGRLGGR